MDPIMASALIGAGGQLMGGKKAAKAQKSAAGQQMAMAAPYMKAAGIALPQMTRLVTGQMVPEVGKESPILAGEHRENLAGIGRVGRQETGAAKRFWGTTGNVGRGRGELSRLAFATTGATNRENLAYGGAQEGYKRSRMAEAMGGLSTLAGLGSQGLGAGVTGAQGYGNAASSVWQNFGDVIGQGVGSYQAQMENKRLMDLLERYYGTKKIPKTYGGYGGPGPEGGYPVPVKSD